MKKTYCITILLIATFICNGLFLNQFTVAKEYVGETVNYESYCRTPFLESFNIDRNKTIEVDHYKNPIYCTFKNNNEAIEQINRIEERLLSEISKLYSLPKMNSNNWEQYRNIVMTSEIGNEKERQELVEFFDIFENSFENKRILDEVAKLQNKSLRTIDENINIGTFFPSYAPIAQHSDLMIKTQNQISRFYLPNIDNAIAYARRYALHPNINGYGVAKGGWFDLVTMDCTNFASQILEASGINQQYYNNKNMGWWHRKNGNNHEWSTSWINADVFARYMGVGYSTQSHKDFSNNLIKGDFITYDAANDGKWDHMAFVADVAWSEGQHSNGYYRDYLVAQHTSNYFDWSSNHGWATAGRKYGRVRR